MPLPDGVKCLTITCICFNTIPACDRQTDRQTDKQTDRSATTISHYAAIDMLMHDKKIAVMKHQNDHHTDHSSPAIIQNGHHYLYASNVIQLHSYTNNTLLQTNSHGISLSIRFNGHFPNEPGLASI